MEGGASWTGLVEVCGAHAVSSFPRPSCRAALAPLTQLAPARVEEAVRVHLDPGRRRPADWALAPGHARRGWVQGPVIQSPAARASREWVGMAARASPAALCWNLPDRVGFYPQPRQGTATDILNLAGGLAGECTTQNSCASNRTHVTALLWRFALHKSQGVHQVTLVHSFSFRDSSTVTHGLTCRPVRPLPSSPTDAWELLSVARGRFLHVASRGVNAHETGMPSPVSTGYGGGGSNRDSCGAVAQISEPKLLPLSRRGRLSAAQRDTCALSRCVVGAPTIRRLDSKDCRQRYGQRGLWYARSNGFCCMARRFLFDSIVSARWHHLGCYRISSHQLAWAAT